MVVAGGLPPTRTPPTGRPSAGGKFSSASPFGRPILIIIIIIINDNNNSYNNNNSCNNNNNNNNNINNDDNNNNIGWGGAAPPAPPYWPAFGRREILERFAIRSLNLNDDNNQ